MKRIGIFDSGVGGVAFAKKLKSIHPELKIKLVRDNKNMFYGDKTPRTIERLTDYAIQPTLTADAIVLVCNTATAYALDYLRVKYPSAQFIGLEPDLRVAASRTKSGQIAVLSTPAVLKSSRYFKLKQLYGKYVTIFEPALPTLSRQIETKAISWPKLEVLLTNLVNQHVDVMVTGCTHYDFIAPRMQEIVGNKAQIITPAENTLRQIEKLLYRNEI